MSRKTKTIAMKEDGKSTLTPKLRFPEFRDKPAWEETILGSVLTEHGETNDGASEVHSVSVHKGVINQVEHLGRSFAAADRSNYNLAKPHDVIYTKSPTGDFPWGVVKQNRLPYNVIVSPLYGVFSPVNRHLGYILDAYFESPIRTTNYLAPITQKGAKNTIQISNATFLSKGLYLPSIEAEQQKIAECLSTLDELIGAESQKLDALKAHKKGLMQQLFPREGETLPRMRFPEFQNAPAWEEKEVGDVFKVTRGQVLAMKLVNESKTSEAPYPVYSSQTKNTGLCGFYSEFLFEDAITWTTDGANAGDVNFRLGKFYCTNVCGVLLNTDGYANQCIASLINSVSRKYVSYVGNPKLMNGVMSEIVIPVPILPEQQRIASCLSSLDDLIAAQSGKLEALKTHKKGLMQQLFPSPTEAEA